MISGSFLREFRILLSPADLGTEESAFIAPARPRRLLSPEDAPCRACKEVESLCRLLLTAVSFPFSLSLFRESASRSIFAAELPALERIWISRESIVTDIQYHLPV